MIGTASFASFHAPYALHAPLHIPTPIPGPVRPSPAMDVAERDLMEAMRAYKQWSGRMFPTWSEVLEVLVALGYRKGLNPTLAPSDA